MGFLKVELDEVGWLVVDEPIQRITEDVSA